MKTKHHKWIFILSIISSFTLPSCTEWLSIEPEGKIVLSDYWKNEADVEAVIATCYRTMIEDDFMKRLIVWGELRSDNTSAGLGISDTERRILEANILPANDYARWASLYRVINYCNSVLRYAPEVLDPNFSVSKLRAKEAEAKALRALTYFYLVRVFKNVPLVTEPSISDIQDYNVAQSSEDEILDLIEADLLFAETWAMNSFSSIAHTKGRITRNAVRAILADVYLWRNKYEEAIVYCDKIINQPVYKFILADDDPYLKIFGDKNSSESIFELQFGESFKVNQKVYDFYGTRNNQRGQFSASRFIGIDNTIFSATDVRRKDFLQQLPQNGLYNITKYAISYRSEFNDGSSNYFYRTTTPNWVMYRLTDIMLMKAEALVQLSRDESDLRAALEIVNTTYLRSNPLLLNDSLKFENYNTKREMEELVMLERQRELMFEGKRWFDLVRMARRDGKTDRMIDLVLRKFTENQSLIKSKMKDMNAMYMPIHEDEIKANKKLTQNPYYETGLK